MHDFFTSTGGDGLLMAGMMSSAGAGNDGIRGDSDYNHNSALYSHALLDGGTGNDMLYGRAGDDTEKGDRFIRLD